MSLCADQIDSSVNEYEISFYQFVDRLIVDGLKDNMPKPAKTYQLESLKVMSKGVLRTCLVYTLIQLSSRLCLKKVENLNWSDVNLIQRYFNSFGYQIIYKPDQKTLDKHQGDLTKLTFKDFLLFFQPL